MGKVYTKQEYLELVQKSKPRKKRDNPEHRLQKACVTWFKAQYKRYQFLIMAIPNGAHLYGDKKERSIQWNILKSEGALKGAADLFLAVPSGDLAGLFIEMKTPKGQQRKEQIQFEGYVLNIGYGYAMPRSIDEFMKVVDSYLENGTY